MSYGVLYGKNEAPMSLHETIGTATDEDGNKFELISNLPARTMEVVDLQTDKVFQLGWNDVINMAVEAGISSEGG